MSGERAVGAEVVRAVPEFMCPLEISERWHFLEENATQQSWLLGIAILEPL